MAHILMLAAENDALPGGKVGGVGDVVRDVPPALAAQGCQVTVVMPAYGIFADLPGTQQIARVHVNFAHTRQPVDLYQVPNCDESEHEIADNIAYWVLDHPLFAACGNGKIYCDDPPTRPFATDATKFAFYCAAVAEAVVQNRFGNLDVVHLHDWQAAFYLILRRYHPAYQTLQTLRCAFTIHNLALQGIRPFRGDRSSLDAWFPDLPYEESRLADPRWPDCINPMAVGIRLADSVHVVSPAYAQEILQPSVVAGHGVAHYGGEGLEGDLRVADSEGRLFGILNGCEYPAPSALLDWDELYTLMQQQVLRWAASQTHIASSHFIAEARLRNLNGQRPSMLLTSVGRITDQKMKLLLEPSTSGQPTLEGVLTVLGEKGVLLLLGSGDADYEQFLTATAGRFNNFIFLNGYSDPLAQALYVQGDLFLMPSSFEPCGISQMLALRAGQPCLVHHVGGLRDTVTDNVTGFTFNGANPTEQAEQLVATVQKAVAIFANDTEHWQQLRAAAASQRFLWADSVKAYRSQLYQLAEHSS